MKTFNVCLLIHNLYLNGDIKFICGAALFEKKIVKLTIPQLQLKLPKSVNLKLSSKAQ